MPKRITKTPELAAEPCVIHADGTVSDAEIWADILGDDIAPWDMTCEEYGRRHNLPSVPNAPLPTRRRTRKAR